MKRLRLGLAMLLGTLAFLGCPLPTRSPVTTTYSVTYLGNSPTSGSVPVDPTAYNSLDTVTVLGNSGFLGRTGYAFAGWNTKADGSGISYANPATFPMGSSAVTLYAIWIPTSLNFSTTVTSNVTDIQITSYSIALTGALAIPGGTASACPTSLPTLRGSPRSRYLQA